MHCCTFVRNVSAIKRLPLFRARFLSAKRLRNGRHQGLATTSDALCGPPLGQLTTCNHQPWQPTHPSMCSSANVVYAVGYCIE